MAMTWEQCLEASEHSGKAMGRLQVFQLGKRGAFELVQELEGITCGKAGKVKRPVDSVACWRPAVGIQGPVVMGSCPVVLAAFKAWHVGL